MELINTIFSAVILLLSIWILLKLSGHGGFVGSSLNLIGYGTVVLGLSQVIETVRLDYWNIQPEMMEMAHHFIFIMGLVMIAIGFRNLMGKRG